MTTGRPGMEPRHLTALVAVRREGSFRGAATRLGLVQSVVSQRIAQLEQLVGVSLVERSRGPAPVELTEAGATLVAHAEDILAAFDAALADLRALDGGPELRIRVGAYESVAASVLPRAIAALRGSVAVTLHEQPVGEEFFDRVATGALDAAFADIPLRGGPFAWRELMPDPCVLVVPSDSLLARRSALPTPREICALPLIEAAWPLLRLLTDQLRLAGAEPRFVCGSQTNAAVQALVAQGVGAALMPLLAVNRSDRQIAVIDVSHVLPPRRIALYWHRDRRELTGVMRLLEALESVCAAGRELKTAA